MMRGAMTKWHIVLEIRVNIQQMFQAGEILSRAANVPSFPTHTRSKRWFQRPAVPGAVMIEPDAVRSAPQSLPVVHPPAPDVWLPAPDRLFPVRDPGSGH